MTHIFLTGEVQIGKSTVIQKTAAALDGAVGGFCTGFGPDRGAADRWLYLWDASGSPVYEESHGVVRFADRRPEVFPDRFDALGGGALRRARAQRVSLILMDECGRFESGAAEFQREIFAALEGEIPVLGVIRQGFSGWLDRLRAHPSVSLLTVTAENRDALPRRLCALLQQGKSAPAGRPDDILF